MSDEAIDVLQVYGQREWHGEAIIKGNRAGLIGLRDAVDKALQDGTSRYQAFPSDGEGYELVIERIDAEFGDDEWRKHEPEYQILNELTEWDKGYEQAKADLKIPSAT